MQRNANTFIRTIAFALLVVGCQTGTDSIDPEARGLVIERADQTAIRAYYASDAITLRIDSRVVDGNVETTVETADNVPLTKLVIPADPTLINSKAIVPYVMDAEANARAVLDEKIAVLEVAYPAMIDALFAATTDLGDAPVRMATMHHASVVGAHQWRTVQPLTDDECDGDEEGAPWHAPWMHLRTGDVADMGAYSGGGAAQICGWVSIGCYLHDKLCCDCGFLCGSGCTTGCGAGSCVGRCGGGCGSCDPW